MVRFYSGEVSENPALATDLIRVGVPDNTQLGRQVYGPMRFNPNITGGGGVTLPVKGDKALIAVDDRGPTWLITWIH